MCSNVLSNWMDIYIESLVIAYSWTLIAPNNKLKDNAFIKNGYQTIIIQHILFDGCFYNNK